MLANRHIPMSEASKWTDHPCTGWLGADEDRRLACTVGEAVQHLMEDGIVRGYLAIIELGSQVEMRSELPGLFDLGVGHVLGIRHGHLRVHWSTHDQKTEVAHHLVRLTDDPWL